MEGRIKPRIHLIRNSKFKMDIPSLCNAYVQSATHSHKPLSIGQYINLQIHKINKHQSRTGFRRILCSRGSVGESAGNSTYAGPDDVLCTVWMPLSRSASRARSTFVPGISAVGVCISYFWSCGISYAGVAAGPPAADAACCRRRLRRRRTRQKANRPQMMSRPPTPPTMPPTMAPVWL